MAFESVYWEFLTSYKQGVTGSNPVGPTLIIKQLRILLRNCFFICKQFVNIFNALKTPFIFLPPIRIKAWRRNLQDLATLLSK